MCAYKTPPQAPEANDTVGQARAFLAPLKREGMYPIAAYDDVLKHALALEEERHRQAMEHIQQVYPAVKEELQRRNVAKVSGITLIEDLSARLPGAALGNQLDTVENTVDKKISNILQRGFSR